MNKEQIDRVWKYYLPKEFKEEVKKLYTDALDASNSPHEPDDRKWGNYRVTLLENLFGIHNLTSDAEGEEMLTVSRKKVQEFYAKCKEVTKNPYSYPDYSHESALSRMALLDILFGSKCLPNEEPKPAEPKFKPGDKVLRKCHDYEDEELPYDIFEGYHGKDKQGYICGIESTRWLIHESDLEPYTEPSNEESAALRAESVKESRIASEESHLRNLSQSMSNCNKSDEGFPYDARKCGTVYQRRKMDMAATIAAGILAGSDFMTNDCTKEAFDKLAEVSLVCAESIISKTLKGDSK